jgi:magnesium-transporting ATPase (P-type)
LTQQAQLQKEDLELIRLPFTSKRKKASVVVRQPALEGTEREVRVYTNGGPDYLGARVTRFLNASGVEEGIDDSCSIPEALAGQPCPEGVEDNTHRAMLEKTVKNFADQAYRTILVCYRDMSMEQFEQMKEDNNNFEADEDRDCLE